MRRTMNHLPKIAAILGLAALGLALLVGCRGRNSPLPIPDDKKDYIGRWRGTNGFLIEILPSGVVNAWQEVAPEAPIILGKAEFLEMKKASLRFDDQRAFLVLTLPGGVAQELRIDERPHADHGYQRLKLNGVVFTQDYQ